MSKPIIKLDMMDDYGVLMIARTINENAFPFSFSAKYKDGKKKRLRKVHIISYRKSDCELCGFHEYLTYRYKGQEHMYSDR